MTTLPTKATVHFARGIQPYDIPATFCDGVANLSRNSEIAKFYLFRTDPSIDQQSEFNNAIVHQIIMPLSSLVSVAAFFEASVKNWVKDGLITQDDVDAARKLYDAD